MALGKKGGSLRVILFDAVGTLLRPSPCVADAYFQLAQQFGTRKTHAEVQQRFATAMQRYAPYGIVPITSIGPRATGRRVPVSTSEEQEFRRWRSIVRYVFDDVASQSQALFQLLWEHFASSTSWQLYDDVVPAWNALTASGYRLGLASNFDARLVNLCRSLPPLDDADYCFISSTLQYPKPHPRFYREIQRRLALPASQLMMVGDDRVNDYEAPLAAGWQAVHLCREGNSGDGAISTLGEMVERL